MIILDACRDNPFAEGGVRSIGGSRGLARVDAPEGTFVMYSAGAGQTALDRLSDNDADANSVFTRSLIPLITTPGLGMQEVALKVRERVVELANSVGHRQTPAYYDQLLGRFCPAGCEVTTKAKTQPVGDTAAAKPPSQPQAAAPLAPASPRDTASPTNAAAEGWAAVKDTTSIGVLEAFIAQFGNSFYGELARAGYSMKCFDGMDACYKQAGEVCPAGYTIIDRATGTVCSSSGSCIPGHSLAIECK